MSKARLLGLNFSCTKVPSGLGMILDSLKAGVGDAPPPRCRNLDPDVRKVQTRLNLFHPVEGGPMPPLIVDGKCGMKTKQAIRRFQEVWRIYPVGQSRPDGIVDPPGKTWERLDAGPGRLIDLPTEFATRIPRVIEIVTATRAVLALARDFLLRPKGGSSAIGMIGQAELHKVDRHFHILTKSNPVQRLGSIDGIFSTMLTAIGYIPQGVVIAMDEPPNIARGSYMFTFMGGYHIRNKNQVAFGVHPGTIYLCPGSRSLGPESFAYAMIHELAHYCGPDSEWGIDDRAYFMRDPELYRKLTADEAYTNADSYAQLAFDAIGRPDFSPVQ